MPISRILLASIRVKIKGIGLNDILMYGVNQYGLVRTEKGLWDEDSSEEPHGVNELSISRPHQRSYVPAAFVALVLSVTFLIVWRTGQLEGSEEGSYIRPG